MDPAVIAFHAAQGAQVLQGAADHARHGGDRFQHNRAVTVAAREESVGEEARRLGESQGKPIGKILWGMVPLKRIRIRHGLFPWDRFVRASTLYGLGIDWSIRERHYLSTGPAGLERADEGERREGVKQERGHRVRAPIDMPAIWR